MLFIISFIFIAVSTFLLTSVVSTVAKLKYQNKSFCFITFFLLGFAQLIFTTELLSLFESIKISLFLICNLCFLVLSIYVFIKTKSKFLTPFSKNDFVKIYKALKKDRMLLFFGICFLFCLSITFWIALNAGVGSYDALSYHLARCAFWIKNSSLAHFVIADSRNLIMPINSEILYTWVLLFFKEDVGLGLFSFCSYLLSITLIYNILGILKFSTRRKLWTIFVYAAFAGIIAEASSIETDLLLGTLVLSSIYLFLIALKEDNKIPLYFSSLAYAIALGTKTTAFIAIPGIILLFLYIEYLYRKKNYEKYFTFFLLFLLINFIIFSSYNYILNYIDYSNPFGSAPALKYHSFFGGPKALIANIIRYIMLLFDFSGLNYSYQLEPFALTIRDSLFKLIGISTNAGVISPLRNVLNNSLIDTFVGIGFIGTILFIPAIFISLIKGLKKNAKKSEQFLGSLALVFIINIIFLSCSIGFMIYSVRFLNFFAIISAPILAWTYIKSNKNIFKWIIAFYVFSYFVVISTNIETRPFWEMQKTLKKVNNSHALLREKMRCSSSRYLDGQMDACIIAKNLNSNSENKKILVLTNHIFRSYYIKLLDFKGWQTNFELLENYDNINLDDYSYIITNNIVQDTDNIKLYNRSISSPKYIYSSSKIACFYSDYQEKALTENEIQQPVYNVCLYPTDDFKKHGFIKKALVLTAQDNDSLNKNSVILYEKINY